MTLRYSLFAARLRALRHDRRRRSPPRILGRSSSAHPCVLVVPRMRARAPARPLRGALRPLALVGRTSRETRRSSRLAEEPAATPSPAPYTQSLRSRKSTARLRAQVASARVVRRDADRRATRQSVPQSRAGRQSASGDARCWLITSRAPPSVVVEIILAREQFRILLQTFNGLPPGTASTFRRIACLFAPLVAAHPFHPLNSPELRPYEGTSQILHARFARIFSTPQVGRSTCSRNFTARRAPRSPVPKLVRSRVLAPSGR